jgi:hypothetical protein
VSQSFEKVCLEFTELLSHSTPVLPNRVTLLNGSDVQSCTFLHILMFLLASSQRMLDLSSAIASPAGFQNKGCSGFNWLCDVDCWRLSVTLRDYDHEFMEVSGFTIQTPGLWKPWKHKLRFPTVPTALLLVINQDEKQFILITVDRLDKISDTSQSAANPTSRCRTSRF